MVAKETPDAPRGDMGGASYPPAGQARQTGHTPDRESLEDVCTAAAIRKLVMARVVSPDGVHGDTNS
jgi:hypothetical protein